MGNSRIQPPRLPFSSLIVLNIEASFWLKPSNAVLSDLLLANEDVRGFDVDGLRSTFGRNSGADSPPFASVDVNKLADWGRDRTDF